MIRTQPHTKIDQVEEMFQKKAKDGCIIRLNVHHVRKLTYNVRSGPTKYGYATCAYSVCVS